MRRKRPKKDDSHDLSIPTDSETESDDDSDTDVDFNDTQSPILPDFSDNIFTEEKRKKKKSLPRQKRRRIDEKEYNEDEELEDVPDYDEVDNVFEDEDMEPIQKNDEKLDDDDPIDRRLIVENIDKLVYDYVELQRLYRERSVPQLRIFANDKQIRDYIHDLRKLAHRSALFPKRILASAGINRDISSLKEKWILELIEDCVEKKELLSSFRGQKKEEVKKRLIENVKFVFHRCKGTVFSSGNTNLPNTVPFAILTIPMLEILSNAPLTNSTYPPIWSSIEMQVLERKLEQNKQFHRRFCLHSLLELGKWVTSLASAFSPPIIKITRGDVQGSKVDGQGERSVGRTTPFVFSYTYLFEGTIDNEKIIVCYKKRHFFDPVVDAIKRELNKEGRPTDCLEIVSETPFDMFYCKQISRREHHCLHYFNKILVNQPTKVVLNFISSAQKFTNFLKGFVHPQVFVFISPHKDTNVMEIRRATRRGDGINLIIEDDYSKFQTTISDYIVPQLGKLNRICRKTVIRDSLSVVFDRCHIGNERENLEKFTVKPVFTSFLQEEQMDEDGDTIMDEPLNMEIMHPTSVLLMDPSNSFVPDINHEDFTYTDL